MGALSHRSKCDTRTNTYTPKMIRYPANTANPCFRTQPKNHATATYATMNDTTNPIASTTHPCGSMSDTPIGFSPLPITDFKNVYPVATTIVGNATKNENSSADARDIPANCPPTIVDMDRDVPGNTAEKIWQNPTQTACPKLISSMCHVRMRLSGAPGPACSDFAFLAST